MTPMALATLLLLAVLGTGTCDPATIMPLLETTVTDTTTTETTTTDTTATTETTAETTATPLAPAPPVTIPRWAFTNGTQTFIPSRTTIFPPATNTTNFQPGNISTTNSTAAPIPAISNASSSNWDTPLGTNATEGSSTRPIFPTGARGAILTTSSANGNGNSSTRVIPTWKSSVAAQGSTAPMQTPMAVLGGGTAAHPGKATAVLPTAVQLLLRVPLSFRILNRSFNESLRDPVSEEYRRLSRAVLTMFEYVYGCGSCAGREIYKGCSELRFSQGSVEVQSTLVFGHGDATVASDVAEQRLRDSLDQNGFVMDLQLASIRTGTAEVTSPAPVPVVPDWAIALLVLVCILLLLSILTCFLMTTCTCRRKSRGELDLLSTKDSYHPMADYPPYQSHGRYVPPASKPNPYSQVASSNGAGTGTFTYTNPAAASDNL
ncbi:mucin-1 [Nyctibius grandis]